MPQSLTTEHVSAETRVDPYVVSYCNAIWISRNADFDSAKVLSNWYLQRNMNQQKFVLNPRNVNCNMNQQKLSKITFWLATRHASAETINASDDVATRTRISRNFAYGITARIQQKLIWNRVFRTALQQNIVQQKLDSMPPPPLTYSVATQHSSAETD